MATHESGTPEASDDIVRRDIDTILWSIKLQQIRRFTNQRFWEMETREAEFAARVESSPALESVADHSWHVSDAVLILAEHCAPLDVSKCLKLAILHDKMEIIINDWSPLGRDGTGRNSHAFNRQRRLQKEVAEKEAIDIYTARLRPSLRREQEGLLMEAMECRTQEARFVKAVDKLQSLAFVYSKKKGDMQDRHIVFTMRYAEQACQLCPPLSAHYTELRRRIVRQVAKKRKLNTRDVENIVLEPMLPLFES